MRTRMPSLREPARNLPVAGEYDVIVCGGGPAGVAAAISAARAGAQTGLIEAQGFLGGIWTAGLLPWVLDGGNKSGLMAELHNALRKKDRPTTPAPAPGGHWKTGERSAYDVEQAKHGLEQCGLRESRRIHGRYRLTRADLIRGATFEDAVCTVRFPVDIHATDPSTGTAYGGGGVTAKPYEIPLRALIARDVSNLLMAGRCISGDFFAHASYRVTGNAVAMGEAAGRAAARWNGPR